MNKSQIEATTSPVPKEAVATPADVEKALSLTDEQLVDLQKERDLAIYRSRAILSPEERRRGRGVELEKHYKITGNMDGLAEAFALQGRYGEAAEVAASDRLKATYSEKHRAVEREDNDCECDSFSESGDYLLPNQYIESYGYSAKHGKDMPFIRCQACGELNAMPSLPHLSSQQQLRHNSQASDSERLKFFKK